MRGRYHLYVSLARPWAHRTLIFRKLKGLEQAIDLSVVNWFMGDDGWTFASGRGGIPDPLHKAKLLRDMYVASKRDYAGRVSVPVL
jgi:putative glutathione S-transferase